MRCGPGAWVWRSRARCTRCGPGWVLQPVSAARIWNAGGNCSIRGATRRRHAVTGLLMLPNPHLPGLLGRWVRLGEAWAVSGGCGAFGRFSRFHLGSSGGCNGGNCTTWGFDTPATRRWKASCSAKPPPPPVWRAPEGPRPGCGARKTRGSTSNNQHHTATRSALQPEGCVNRVPVGRVVSRMPVAS